MMEAVMRVGLFVTCLVDTMRPEIGFSVIKLLEAAGCEVVVVQSQTCCGQPAYSAGNRPVAQALAKKFITEFQHFEYIVIPSGSCGGMVKTHYVELFSEDAAWKQRAENLAPRVFELTDFLQTVVKINRLPRPRNGSFRGNITYHDSCCGLRELGVEAQPRALLNKVADIQLSEMKDSRACCGFGGTFAVKYGEISTAIVDEKCANIHACKADAVVMGDLGCMLNIEGRLRRTGDDTTRVLHIAQVLAGDV
jgi:L-lactate dehydrogenase complex protein LldE